MKAQQEELQQTGAQPSESFVEVPELGALGLETSGASKLVDVKGTSVVTLPSGGLAMVRVGYGRDIMHASRLAGQMKAGDAMRLPIALIAVKVRLLNADVKLADLCADQDLWKDLQTRSVALTMEQVLNEMNDIDAFHLIGEVQTPQKKSSASST